MQFTAAFRWASKHVYYILRVILLSPDSLHGCYPNFSVGLVEIPLLILRQIKCWAINSPWLCHCLYFIVLCLQSQKVSPGIVTSIYLSATHSVILNELLPCFYLFLLLLSLHHGIHTKYLSSTLNFKFALPSILELWARTSNYTWVS